MEREPAGENRKVGRLTPTGAVTVAVDAKGTGTGYGVVADMSDLGIGVLTNAGASVDDDVILAVSFPGEPQPVSLPATIRWIAQDSPSVVRWGLQLGAMPEPTSRRLRDLVRKFA